MVMAFFLRGKPNMEPYLTTGSGYNAGDVILIGNFPAVGHVDDPAYTGATLLDALAVGGGIYQMAADAAYPVGTYVLWDTVKQQVTTDESATAYPFGWIVGGPADRMDDGGPTGAASLCSVLHSPNAAFAGGGGGGASSLVSVFPKNLLDGGDFSTNPFQRGTSQLADITNTATYGPDRWVFLAGASSALDWSQVSDTTLQGFNNALKMQRKSGNADLTVLKMAQVLETLDCVRTQGQTVTLSFWAKKGANYSGGSLSVDLNHSTTAGNDTAAHLFAGSTNWQATPTIIHATQALTTGWVRYQFTGTVPATCTQLGVVFSWTPTGTAGTDDSISFQGVQLEMANGASGFEHRDVEVELALCQRYYFRITEQNGINVAVGAPLAVNSQGYSIPLPTAMRVAPTVTVTAGGFKVIIDGASAAAVTTFAAGSVHSVTFINLTTANTMTVAAHSIMLQGSAATGLIEASADL